MRPGLLDVNVLLALAWPKHQDHGKVCDWFAAESGHGWATCTLTQIGFIRLSSNPAFTPLAVSPFHAAELLKEMTRHSAHRFWEDLDLTKSAPFAKARGHRQVVDAYLVDLARKSHGRLVTLDSGAAGHAGKPIEVCVIQ